MMLQTVRLVRAAHVGGLRRLYSTGAAQPDIQFANLKKTLTGQPKTRLPNKDLVFGRTFSDHMLKIEWSKEHGWTNPSIEPYGKISLEPSATVFHYATECFEGMKAYKDKKGHVRLFRPDMNMKRLSNSAKRLSLPSFNGSELLECIKELVRVDSSWIPQERGYSLYLRPTMIATQETLGVGASNRAMLFVICSPVGPYYRTGFEPVSLDANPKYVRAWPGGTGDVKCGGNYAPSILPQAMSAAEGYQQVLWLYGENHNITEVGTMNAFIYWTNKNGEKELITAPLDGTILPGVTRDSIIQLARSWGEKVTESYVTMPELIEALKEGRVIEMFGAGTACIVSPIKCIRYMGTDYKIPLNVLDPSAKAGILTQKFADSIMDIQYGDAPSPWSVVV